MCEQLVSLLNSQKLHSSHLISQFIYFSDPDGKLLSLPDIRKSSNILNDLKYWHEILNKEVEKFTGDMVLISEESLRKGEKKLQKWTEYVNKLLIRHGFKIDEPKTGEFLNYELLNKVSRLK